jgi:hypothetical protein
VDKGAVAIAWERRVASRRRASSPGSPRGLVDVAAKRPRVPTTAVGAWHEAIVATVADLAGARSHHVTSVVGEARSLSRAVAELRQDLVTVAVDFAKADDVSRVLRVAEEQAGYVEGRGDRTVFGRWFGLDGNPWCAMFVSWAFAQAGVPLPEINGAKGFARVLDGRRYAQRSGRLVWHPKPGDVFFIDHGGGLGHTGIIVSVDETAGTMVTIEGNTNAAGSRSGTMVRSRVRPIRQANAGFWRVRGEIAPEEQVPPRSIARRTPRRSTPVTTRTAQRATSRKRARLARSRARGGRSAGRKRR